MTLSMRCSEHQIKNTFEKVNSNVSLQKIMNQQLKIIHRPICQQVHFGIIIEEHHTTVQKDK